MDFNMTKVYDDTINNIFQNGLYDISKFVLLFIVYKVFEYFWLRNIWGNWKVKVYENFEDNTKPKTTRELTIQSAKKLRTDEGEMSKYLKGLVSPFATLTVDIVSEEAKKMDLYREEGKNIIIDLSKNPPKKDSKTKK